MSPAAKSPGSGAQGPAHWADRQAPDPSTPNNRLFEEKGATDRIVVLLGNSNPQVQIPILNPETGEQYGTRSEPALHLNTSVTRVELDPDSHDEDHVKLALSTDNDRMLSLIARDLQKSKNTDTDDSKWAIVVSELEQILGVHSAGNRPDWVRSSDPNLQRALAEYFDCPEGEPLNLLTNGGRDALHGQHLGTSAQPASFNYMALANSATATAPAATDTSLTGEITTAGGGLLRAQGTYAHTAGTNSSTITKTFTANGSDALPVTVSQMGLFNAASAGTMGYKTALNSNATLTAVGDNVTVTETVNAG